MALGPLRHSGVKSFAPNRGATLAKNPEAWKKDKAEYIKSTYDRLESTFVSSNGTSKDLAKADSSTVKLDTKESGFVSGMRTAGMFFPPFFLVDTLAQAPTKGEARLDSDGNVQSMEAKLSRQDYSRGFPGNVTETIQMNRQEDGSKRYEMSTIKPFGGEKTVMEERNGSLTILEVTPIDLHGNLAEKSFKFA